MKDILTGILAILVLGYLGTFIGWWGIAVVAAIVGFALQMHGGMSFLSGFVGGALFFGVYTYYLDSANEQILSTLIGEVVAFQPFLPTVLIGALLAAMGMLTGKYGRDAILGERREAKYRGRYR